MQEPIMMSSSTAAEPTTTSSPIGAPAALMVGSGGGERDATIPLSSAESSMACGEGTPKGLTTRLGNPAVGEEKSLIARFVGLVIAACCYAGVLIGITEAEAASFGVGAGLVVAMALGALVIVQDTWLEFDASVSMVRFRRLTLVQRLFCKSDVLWEFPIAQLGTVYPAPVTDYTAKETVYPIELQIPALPENGNQTRFVVAELAIDATRQDMRAQITAWRHFLNSIRLPPVGESTVCDAADFAAMAHGIQLMGLAEDTAPSSSP